MDNREADMVFDYYNDDTISRQEFRKRYNAAMDPENVRRDVESIIQHRQQQNQIAARNAARIQRALKEN